MNIAEDMKADIKVTSGIRQGCTGSTTLFKLITYFTLQGMFYVDDSLQLSHNNEEAKTNIRTLLDASRQCGLEINKSKSSIVIYNLEHQPEHIEGIHVTNEIKYL